ncbi:MAG: DUF3857 domain-containing protein [Chitinophagaceae bacterium]|nr:DUF3857 domain-containing protein [Chitinophagaceae bacterium]
MKPLIIKLFVVILLSFVLSSGDAQTIKEELAIKMQSNIESVFKESDAGFNTNQVPEKWKSFSGVIIAQKTKFVFDKTQSGDKLNVYETLRRKVQLLDNDAVSRYSEFYFRTGHINDGFSLRILKADGTVDTVSLLTAVLVEDNDDVPGYFTPYFDKQSTIKDNSKSVNVYYKLAVSNLEPGDIIDYAYTVFNDNDVARMNNLEFDPIYYLCHREYPVMSQQFEINTDEKSYVNSRSLNGAPEFIEGTAGGFRTFTWKDSDREKIKDTRWVNEYMALPLVKFQVIYSKNTDAEELFISDRGELKKSVTPEELAKKVNRIYEKMDASGGRKVTQDNLIANYATSLLNTTEYYLRKTEAYDVRDEDFIKRVYYILRHNNGIYGKRLSSQYFAYVMLQKLKKKGIAADLVVTTSNSTTLMKDVIFGQELQWLVKVKDKFIFNFTPNSNPYDLNDDFLGNEAFTITLGKSPSAAPVTLPSTAIEDNINASVVEATLDDKFEIASVVSTDALKGIFKDDYIGPVLAYTNAYDMDHLNYYGESEIDQLSEKQQDEVQRLIFARKQEYKKRKPLYMKSRLQNDYENVVSYDNFNLLSDGRTFNKQELKYSETFTLGDLTRKAGKNYLVSVPALMGGQLQVKPEDRKRNYDIDVRYPRMLTWEINFTIPAGYTLKGLADLNQHVDNEVGSFTTSAVIEGNILKLNIKKVYKQAKIGKDNFNKMLDFIDAAYNFSQRRILLKKS